MNIKVNLHNSHVVESSDGSYWVSAGDRPLRVFHRRDNVVEFDIMIPAGGIIQIQCESGFDIVDYGTFFQFDPTESYPDHMVYLNVGEDAVHAYQVENDANDDTEVAAAVGDGIYDWTYISLVRQIVK